MKNTHFQHL